MAEPLNPDAMPQHFAGLFCTRNDERVVAGVNDDDCAVLPFGNRLLVVTTDFVNSRPVSLDLGIGDLATVGRLAIAANLADLCGSGARPTCLLLSLMMPRESSHDDAMLIAQGAKNEAQRWGVPIVGGDTKLGKSLAVGATAIGYAESEDALFLKFRARPDDDIWVSGELGSCCAAIAGWESLAGDSFWREWAVSAITEPRLPITQSRTLANLCLSCAGTDISDGLGIDLAQLCSNSGVGARVFAKDIPVHDSVRKTASSLGVPPWAFGLALGGDFQFLATSRRSARAKLTELGFHRIGIVTDDLQLSLATSPSESRPLPLTGHSDGCRMSFVEEVRHILTEITHVGC